MSFGDIMAMVLSTKADEPVLAAAQALSKAYDAHVTATLVSFAPQAAYRFATAGAAAAAGAWSEPPAVDHRSEHDEELKLMRRLERFPRPVRLEHAHYIEGPGVELAAVQSRRASVTILLQPRGAPDAPLRTALFERILYESGRPVLLMPRGWRQTSLGRTVLVAWDGSRAATRAIADAQPLLARAENVFLITIEGEARGGLAIADIAAHVRRLGIRCQQHTVPGSERPTSIALQEECEAVGADMMVMGGYGHSRLQEKLFGGVTQSLVATSQKPLLMSR